MGTILNVHCSCGYISGEHFIGIGFNPDSGRDLASCAHCEEIVSVRSASIRQRCPKCRRKVDFIAIKEEGESSKPITIECPRCKKSTLVLDEVGMWD